MVPDKAGLETYAVHDLEGKYNEGDLPTGKIKVTRHMEHSACQA